MKAAEEMDHALILPYRDNTGLSKDLRAVESHRNPTHLRYAEN
jgi:hypothetical protein